MKSNQLYHRLDRLATASDLATFTPQGTARISRRSLLRIAPSLAFVAALVACQSSSTPATAIVAGGVAIGDVLDQAVGGPPAPRPLAAGTPSPDLRWKIEGSESSIAGLRGQVLLLELFATWCSHCQAEAPVLSRINDLYRESGLIVLGVSASPFGQDQRTPASREDIASYAARYGARFPQVFDRLVIGGQRFGVRGFPSLFLIDRGGVIRFAQEGQVPETTLRNLIEPLIFS